MADIFCDFTSGDDADDGSTRALAKKTLAAALTAAGAGGRVGVKNDSAETQASAMTLTSPGTTASPTQVLCIDWTSDMFGSNAVTTGATVSTTGASNIAFNGFAYCVGIVFTAGDSTNAADFQVTNGTNGQWVFENCGLTLGGNNAGSDFIFGSSALITDSAILKNTTLTFSHTSNRCLIRTGFLMEGGSIAGTIPTTVFHTGSLSGGTGRKVFRGVDLSAAGTGKNLVNVSGARILWHFENCKLGASVALTTGSIDARGGTTIAFVNCDSADTNYRYHRQDYDGTISQESTIVRTGGASDGTTPISRKMVSTADAKFYSPLFFDVMFWNETLSALSLAAEVVSDNVTFTNSELWMEVEALTNTGFPYASFTNDRAASSLATPANQTTSSVDWTTTGLTTPVKQKLEVSVTPAEKGWIRCRIYLAKASSTVYVCPLITGLGFTSGRQWQTADAYVLEGAGGGGGVMTLGGMTGGNQRT